jgi:hypothetical protein
VPGSRSPSRHASSVWSFFQVDRAGPPGPRPGVPRIIAPTMRGKFPTARYPLTPAAPGNTLIHTPRISDPNHARAVERTRATRGHRP